MIAWTLLTLGAVALLNWLVYRVLTRQRRDIVAIKRPGERRFMHVAPAGTTAEDQWPYALMAENAYRDAWTAAQPSHLLGNAQRPVSAALGDPAAGVFAWRGRTASPPPLPLPGWVRWDDFPSASLKSECTDKQLFFEVWQTGHPATTVAIVFRGTVPRYVNNWIANFRWLIHLPNDAYDIVRNSVAPEFARQIRARMAEGSLAGDVVLVSAGHSLGGGLAQQLAYALPWREQGIPTVTRAYVFDPSPVTGFSDVDNWTDLEGTEDKLTTSRIYEYREILSYVRWIKSLLVVDKPPPAISAYRYNFSPLKAQHGWANAILLHSMALLAHGLYEAALHERRKHLAPPQ